ncbi:MAG: HDOD domain-containing protein [Planctomycetota bacterium]
MNAEIIERILGCPTLPSLPAVAARVLELASDEDVSLDELAQTIQQDQALAAKVLRTVNSSYYALRTRVGSIRKAISMLGLGPVKSLTLGFSLVASLDDTSVDGFDFEAYWRRGLYAAAAAARFADVAKLETRDEIFLAALMQDVGMVAMQIGLEGEYARVVAESADDHRTLARREIEQFEMTHAEVGAMLAERWRLPAALVMPIRYHERATAAPQEFNKTTKCVALATLVHDVLCRPGDARPLRYLYKKAADWFGMREPEVDELVKAVAGEVKELGKLFQLDPGEEVDADAILVQAAQQMMDLHREGDTSPDIEFQGPASLLLDERYCSPRRQTLNARGFEVAIGKTCEQAVAEESRITLLLMSIDDFEGVGFEVGAPGVERIQLGCCTLLRKHFEPYGALVADLGKGRFAVIAAAVEREGSMRSADLFRADLERVADAWFTDQDVRPIRVSVGVVSVGAEEPDMLGSPGELVTSAARAMASAQSAGGNCVHVHVPAKAAA